MRLGKFFVYFLFLLLIGSCFSVFLLGSAQVDSSVLSMSGDGWSVKVDSSLQTVLDSKAVPFTTVGKAGVEKELFLTLNSLKDCVSGQIQFKVDVQGLSVYKQLPLDKELNVTDYDFVNATVAMLKDVVVVSRPENVVNSFACFDESGKKVLHIYASKLIDVKGNSVWVDSDLKDGLLTVYLDSKWLDTAVFPVIVDPTFGYTSKGGSYETFDEGTVMVGSDYELSETATATGMSAAMYITSSRNFVAGIYDSDGDKVAQTVTGSSSSLDGFCDELTFSVNPSLSAGTYKLVICCDGRFSIYGDTVTNALGKDVGSYYPTLPAVFGSDGTYNIKASIYVTYTAGDPTPTPTATASPSPSPSSTLSGGSYIFVLGEADWVIALEIVMLVSCFVSFVWFGKVPIVPLLVGLFAFLVSLYTGLSGLWVNVVIGYFGVFVALVGGLTMLLVGLGVRVKR